MAEEVFFLFFFCKECSGEKEAPEPEEIYDIQDILFHIAKSKSLEFQAHGTKHTVGSSLWPLEFCKHSRIHEESIYGQGRDTVCIMV